MAPLVKTVVVVINIISIITNSVISVSTSTIAVVLCISGQRGRLVVKRRNEVLWTHDLIAKARVSITIWGICILSIFYK